MRRNNVGLALVCVCCALAASALAEEEGLYSDKYDYVDVDNILSNPRIREQYYNCFLGSSTCVTPDAKFFKDKFPEAIVTKCKRCTEKQKESFEKIVLYYTEKEPEKWNVILTKSISDFTKKKPQ